LRHEISRADWVGDGVVTVVIGMVVAGAVLLPWANVSTGHHVNTSLRASPGINGALDTLWGAPVLALAALVVVVGLVMIALRPVKLSILPCLGVCLAGLGITLVCFSAGHNVWDPLRPGLGLYLDTIGGILLMPIGLISAMVACILSSPAIMERVRARTAARQGVESPGE
jgi:hypothetical protein